MLVALDSKGDRRLAWKTEKKEKPFYCPGCKEEVNLRKGPVRVHHYAHFPPVTCIYGTGESELHWRLKKEMYEALSIHPNCSKCEPERTISVDGTIVRPDLSLYIKKIPVAIEIQKSTIDLREIAARTMKYYKLNIAVIWILPEELNSTWEEDDDIHTVKIKEWQKYLHAFHLGRLYIWQNGALVRPLHLKEYERYIEPHNYVEDSDYADTDWGQENIDYADVGGYMKKI